MDWDWTENRNESIMEELWASLMYKGVGSLNVEPGLVQTVPLGLNERRGSNGRVDETGCDMSLPVVEV